MSNRINQYTCREGHSIVTKDRHEGVTPMLIPCGQCEKNNEMNLARSKFYNVPPNLKPTHEWYRPNILHRALMRVNNDPSWPHVNMGGLLLRKIRKAELVCYFWQPAGRWYILPYLQFSAEEAEGFGCISLELGFLTRWAALEFYFRKGGQS